MALTINCCLNTSPSPSPSTRSTTSPSWLPLKDQSDWRRKCVAAMACVLISSTAGITDGQDVATAMEFKPIDGSRARLVRWSDKRSCPPWRKNLLENIVPENLPRPSKDRGSNSVTTRQTGGGTAGTGGVLIGFDKSCFSL